MNAVQDDPDITEDSDGLAGQPQEVYFTLADMLRDPTPPPVPSSTRKRPPPNLKRRCVYTVGYKAICEAYVAKPTLKHRELGAEWGIARSTVTNILRQKERWLGSTQHPGLRVSRKVRRMKYPALEATLGNIVHRNPEIRFSDAWLKSEAKKLSSELSPKYGYKCKVSSTWLRMFKLRHGIKHGFCPVHYDGPLAIWKVSQALGLSTGLYVDNTVAEKGDRALQKLMSYPDDLTPDESLRLAPEIQANDSKFAPERRRIRALKRFFADKGCPETNRALTRMLVEELHLMDERLREEMWEDRVD